MRPKIFLRVFLVLFIIFLAAPALADEASRFSSIITMDETQVEADNEDLAELTVYVRDGSNREKVSPVYIATERSLKIDNIWYKNKSNKWAQITSENNSNFSDVSVNGNVIELDGASEYTFRIGSKVAGETTIAVGFNADGNINPYTYLTESNISASAAQIIGTKSLTFRASDIKDITLENAENKNEQKFKIEYKKNKDGQNLDQAGQRKYIVNKDGNSLIKGNRLDCYELTFAVISTGDGPVEGRKVEFSLNSKLARVDKEAVETDIVGEAKVRVYARDQGTFTLTAKAGNIQTKVELVFINDPYDIKILAGTAPILAIDEAEPAKIRVQLYDMEGNPVNITNIKDRLLNDEIINIEWEELPEDSDLDNDFNNISDFNTANLLRYHGTDILQIWLPKLDAEGHYKLKMYLDNGKNVVYEFDAKKQGEIVRVGLFNSYIQCAVPLGEPGSAGEIHRYDAQGARSLVPATSPDLEYYVNDHRLLQNEWTTSYKYNPETMRPDPVNGVYYKVTNGADLSAKRPHPTISGYFLYPTAFLLTDDDDFVGESLVINMIDKKYNKVSETKIKIGGPIMNFTINTNKSLSVNKMNYLDFEIVDTNGVRVATGDNVAFDNVFLDFIIKSKPENAEVIIDTDGEFSRNLVLNGKDALKISCTEPGKVETTIILKMYERTVPAGGLGKLLHTFVQDVTFNFTEELVVNQNSKLTLFTDSTNYMINDAIKNGDIIPIVQNGRTFVPARLVAEALGSQVEWDEENQLVTISKEGKTILAKIGMNELKFNDNSVVSMDVAPFIADSRVFLPFRAIGEAFGAEVEAVVDANNNVKAVTFNMAVTL